mmetsp:Transcript_23012/g.58579  ORF Transcript_23012/g.58579 Transcript_23012/m.58579 type:complete len:232 (-) Transcript_23012:156-851(-)
MAMEVVRVMHRRGPRRARRGSHGATRCRGVRARGSGLLALGRRGAVLPRGGALLGLQDGEQPLVQLLLVGEGAGRELRVQQVAVVGHLEGVDRLHRLRDHVEAVDGAEGDHAVLVHLGVQRGRRPAEQAEELLAEEEEERRARLRRAHRADPVLHLHRRRVRAAFNLEPGEAPLQFLCAPAELPPCLSRLAELDPEGRVHALDRGRVVARDDVVGGEVDGFLGLVVQRLEE